VSKKNITLRSFQLLHRKYGDTDVLLSDEGGWYLET